MMAEEQKKSEPHGDGKAVFIELGTDDEYEEYVKNEVHGWGGFIKKVFNLNKDETDSE
jgi:hypothetical protein